MKTKTYFQQLVTSLKVNKFYLLPYLIVWLMGLLVVLLYEKNIYTNFITTQFEASQTSIEDQLNSNKTIQKIYWLKENRKGSFFIETSILLSQLKYNLENHLIIKEA